MTLIHEIVSNSLPVKRRAGSRGWITCNAVCCHHRGHKQDMRSRGNFLFTPDGLIVYNCYNCGFKTMFDNNSLSKPFESLMVWMGVSQDDINKIKLEILANTVNGNLTVVAGHELRFTTEFAEVELPEYAIPFDSLMEEDELPDEFLQVASYLGSRGEAVLSGWNFHWTPSTKWNLNKRVIIPFYYKDKVVGWTARYAGKPPSGISRYFNSDLPPGYLFNCDVLNTPHRKFVAVLEGPFDAIAVDGVGTLGSELSREQIVWLNSTDKEKIIVPDRQRSNQGLIDAALEHGWAVSFPEWEDGVKDAADASSRYGKLFTLDSILRGRTKNKLQIGIKRRMFK